MGLVVVLAADEDVRLAQLAGVAADRDALEDEVGVKVHQEPVFEGARLALVGVDREVAFFDIGVGAGVAVVGHFGAVVELDGGQKGPLEAGGEAGPAAAAEHGGFDLAGDLAGLHAQGLAEALVAAACHVLVVGDDVAVLDPAERWGGDVFEAASGGRGCFRTSSWACRAAPDHRVGFAGGPAGAATGRPIKVQSSVSLWRPGATG